MKAGYGRGYYGEEQLAREPRRPRSWFTIVAVIGAGAAVVWFLWPRKTGADLGLGVGDAPRLLPTAAPSWLPEPAPTVMLTPAAEPTLSGLAALPAAPPQLLPAPPMTAPLLALPAPAALPLKQLEDDARSRGFTGVKDYEDSVVTSAKQLQAAGAKVVFAPHLQHLATRLDPAR